MPAINAPNFLVIGAQKAGTTYLCDKLAAHPEIFFATKKEPMFFQRSDVSARSFTDYRRYHFAGAKKFRWRGEGSTIYFQIPRALKNIKKALGAEARFIVCLREPTDKAVSAYMHNWRKGHYKKPVRILDADAAYNLGPRAASRYSRHMLRWMAAYPREQIEVILFDKLKESPAAFVKQALDFLGLEDHAKPDPAPVNKGSSLVWDGDLLTVADPGKRWRPTVSRDEIAKLHKGYSRDVARLENLLGIDLSKWKEPPTIG